jgi:hypothetical protein
MPCGQTHGLVAGAKNHQGLPITAGLAQSGEPKLRTGRGRENAWAVPGKCARGFGPSETESAIRRVAADDGANGVAHWARAENQRETRGVILV